ncbi:hypothetical protein [Singulisphaera acidiphila]|nr:hypothetical protein [Singulisphaera acidiphila]
MAGLPAKGQAELWNALYLLQPEVEELLAHSATMPATCGSTP